MLWLPHRRRGMGGGLDPAEAAVVAAVLVLTAAAMAAPAEGASWCIARSGASQTALQTALDYACGAAGADCTPIQPSGLCYLPNTVQAHASYAFNSYYQRSNMAPGSCDFAGTATVTITDPSFGSCTYPSSPNTAGGGVTPTTTPVTNTPPTTNLLPPPTTTTPPSFGGGGGVGGGGGGGLTPGFGSATPDSSYAAAAAPRRPRLLPWAVNFISVCFVVVVVVRNARYL